MGELKLNVDNYNKLQVRCARGIKWYTAELKKIHKERHQLEAKSSGVMIKEDKIKACVADHIKDTFCNYKIGGTPVKKPSCNCPCFPGAAKVFYDRVCPPTAATLPTPEKCRPQHISLSNKSE